MFWSPCSPLAPRPWRWCSRQWSAHAPAPAPGRTSPCQHRCPPAWSLDGFVTNVTGQKQWGSGTSGHQRPWPWMVFFCGYGKNKQDSCDKLWDLNRIYVTNYGIDAGFMWQIMGFNRIYVTNCGNYAFLSGSLIWDLCVIYVAVVSF